MRGQDLSWTEFNELDTEFHVQVARASRNTLAIDLMQALRDAVRARMTEVFEELPEWRNVADELASEHEALVDAIEQRDEALAARVVVDHITRFYDDRVRKHTDPKERRIDQPHSFGLNVR